MLALSASCRYFLYRKPTDMRCGFYSLAGLVSNELGQDPLSGDVFVFIGKQGNQIRLLQWDRDGFALYCKRLEQGTFQRPTAASHQLTDQELIRSAAAADLAGYSARIGQAPPTICPSSSSG